jgi:Secretion system C-terminal sorting domain
MELLMYPNPSSEFTTLVWKSAILDFTIVNSVGVVVANHNNKTSPFVLPISEWSNGLYYIVFSQGKKTVHLPLIKVD